LQKSSDNQRNFFDALQNDYDNQGKAAATLQNRFHTLQNGFAALQNHFAMLQNRRSWLKIARKEKINRQKTTV
jgi:hypothetical protein